MSAPAPEMIEFTVKGPLVRLKVPVPAKVIALVVDSAFAVVGARVPPLKLNGFAAAPKLLSALYVSVPPFIDVVPVYEFVPDSVNVPVPFIVRPPVAVLPPPVPLSLAMFEERVKLPA